MEIAIFNESKTRTAAVMVMLAFEPPA